eukprot:gene10661-13058_t
MSLSVSPWTDFRKMEKMMNRDMWGMMPMEHERDWSMMMGNQMWRPLVDVKETDNHMMIKCDLPGMKKEDIHIEMSNGMLCICGERCQEKEDKGEKYHRVERCYGKFQRSFACPEGCNTQDIQAKFENGVLEVCLPKKQKASESHKIMIK